MHGNPHIGLHTIRGVHLGNGRRLIDRKARLGLRLHSDLLPRALKLAGKSLDLDGCKLRVGVSDTRALIPAAKLHCRVVTTKNGDDPAASTPKSPASWLLSTSVAEYSASLRARGPALTALPARRAQAGTRAVESSA